VYEVARAVNIPIVGQGGIETVSDALEFLLAGASALGIGTANFTDPRVPERIVAGLSDYLQRRGLSTIAELTGKANVGRLSAAQIEGDAG
jgi:dihydroorotate dehydrogenase (NAD+) catalytic subunit